MGTINVIDNPMFEDQIFYALTPVCQSCDGDHGAWAELIVRIPPAYHHRLTDDRPMA